MTLEQSATFFTASILTVLGFIVVFGGIIAINNMFHAWWKPVSFMKYFQYPPLDDKTTTDQK